MGEGVFDDWSQKRRDNKRIIGMQPFLYEIGTDIYILGYKSYKKCKEKAIKNLYDEYNKEWKILINKKEINKYDIKDLVKMYHNLLEYVKDNNINQTNNKLIYKMFEKINDEEFIMVYQQIVKFIFCIDFEQGIIYRYIHERSNDKLSIRSED